MEIKENQNEQVQNQENQSATPQIPKPIKTNALLLTIYIFVSFAIVFFVQFLLLPAIDTNAFTLESKANSYWNERVMQIKVGSASGTGFIVETKREDDGTYAYIATAYHVISSDSSSVEARLQSDYVPVQLVGTASNVDLAFFKLKVNDRFALFTTSDVVMGESVYALGNAFNEGICATDGILSKPYGVSNSILASEVTSRIYEGMSGCPVFDNSGELVGMGLSDAYVMDGGVKIYLNKSYVLPADVILNEYERVTKTNKEPITYNVQKGENGAIEIQLKDGAKIVYDGGVIKYNGEKVKTVCGKSVKSLVQFVDVITDYDNLTIALKNSEQVYKITILTSTVHEVIVG